MSPLLLLFPSRFGLKLPVLNNLQHYNTTELLAWTVDWKETRGFWVLIIFCFWIWALMTQVSFTCKNLASLTFMLYSVMYTVSQ